MKWSERFAVELERTTEKIKSDTALYSAQHDKWERRFNAADKVMKVAVAVMVIGIALWIWEIFAVGAFESLPYLLVFFAGYALLMLGYGAMGFCLDKMKNCWPETSGFWRGIFSAFCRSIPKR